MKEDIVFTANYNGYLDTVTLSYNAWGGGDYVMTGRFARGRFLRTPVWGWLYDGTPLELDDIQIIIDIIAGENNLPDDGLDYEHHVVIARPLRRLIINDEDRVKYTLATVDWYWNNRKRRH